MQRVHNGAAEASRAQAFVQRASSKRSGFGSIRIWGKCLQYKAKEQHTVLNSEHGGLQRPRDDTNVSARGRRQGSNLVKKEEGCGNL